MCEPIARRKVDDRVGHDAVEACRDLLGAAFEFLSQFDNGRRRLWCREYRRARGHHERACRRRAPPAHPAFPAHHVVIFSATAVMSSLGGVSPRKACTAAKTASTTSRGVLWRSARTTSSRRSAPNSRPIASLASNTPSVQNTNRSPAVRSNVSSSYVDPAKEPSGTPGRAICPTASPLQRIGYGRPELAIVRFRRLKSKSA